MHTPRHFCVFFCLLVYLFICEYIVFFLLKSTPHLKFSPFPFLQDYVSVLSRPMAHTNLQHPVWTEVYRDAFVSVNCYISITHVWYSDFEWQKGHLNFILRFHSVSGLFSGILACTYIIFLSLSIYSISVQFHLRSMFFSPVII